MHNSLIDRIVCSSQSVLERKENVSEGLQLGGFTAGPSVEGRPAVAKSVVGASLLELRPVPWAFLHGLVQSNFPESEQQLLNEQIDMLGVNGGVWITEQTWRGYVAPFSLPSLLRRFVSDPVKAAQREASFSRLVDSHKIADVRELDIVATALPEIMQRFESAGVNLNHLNYKDKCWLGFFLVKGYLDQRSATSLIEKLAGMPRFEARMDLYHKVKYTISTPLDRLLDMKVLTMPNVQDLLAVYLANDCAYMPELCLPIIKGALRDNWSQIATWNREKRLFLESALTIIVGRDAHNFGLAF